jgi:CheY-like chemotaxis protein
MTARRYLLVDDNRAFAENLAEIVAEQGDEVVVADGAHDALRRIEAHRFDALVTDMQMPGMTGERLVYEARRRDPFLPAIAVTAWAGEESMRPALKQGMLAVLPKPVPLRELLRLLGVARRGALIAVVEDDARLADTLVEVLARHGFTAVWAHSWAEASTLGVQPLAALIDLLLPDSPRGEVLQAVANRFPGVPVIAMTAFRELAREVPVLVLQKPFAASVLMGELERIYARRWTSARA